MSSKFILNNVRSWAMKLERKEAIARLVFAGISARNAEKMLDGKYKHRIRQSTINHLAKAGAL
jgi:hypothetical protein